MINYKSAFDVLSRYGYKHSNTCHLGDETFHDFNNRKRDAAIALIVDECTGSVSRVEVSTRKWDNATRKYTVVNNHLHGLQELINYLKG